VTMWRWLQRFTPLLIDAAHCVRTAHAGHGVPSPPRLFNAAAVSGECRG